MDANARNVWDNGHRKTYAFIGYGEVYQSGWTSHAGRFSTVPPNAVLSSTDFSFATHTFDNGQPGGYYASHVEAQSLYNVEDDTPILVSRPMCDSCQHFVQHLAREKGVIITVGTPDGILEFSNEGSRGAHSAGGELRFSGIPWSMHHEGGRSTLSFSHSHTSETYFSVEQSGGSDPIAIMQHRQTDGTLEKAIYFENKGTVIDTVNVGGWGLDGVTRVGPSDGVQDSLEDGQFSRVPRSLLFPGPQEDSFAAPQPNQDSYSHDPAETNSEPHQQSYSEGPAETDSEPDQDSYSQDPTETDSDRDSDFFQSTGRESKLCKSKGRRLSL